MYLFTLPNTKELSQHICSKTKLKLGKAEFKQLSDGEQYIQVKNKIKGQNVYAIGSTNQPDANIIQFLILINALKENGAEKITAIIPYFGYARQDKLDKPGAPITAKLLAKLFKQAGINQFITVDIHSQKDQKYLQPNLINISTIPLFAKYINNNFDLANTIVVAPDNGAAPRAKYLAKLLNNLPVLVMEKYRPQQNIAKIKDFQKNIKGKNAIITDDMIDTGGTIMAACQELKKHKVRNIYLFITHGVLSEPAIKRLKCAPIKQLVITDTHPISKKKQIKKIKILPIAPEIIKVIK